MRRRVGRTALLVLAGLALLLPMALIAHPIAYVPFLSAVLMVGLSWLYLQLVRRALTVSVDEMCGSCERGATTTLAVGLDNRSPLPLSRVELEFFVTDLFGAYDEVRTLNCSVRGGEDVSLEFDVRFVHVGTYQAGISRVVVHDLLGLFSATIKEGERRQVTVRPRRMSLGQAFELSAAPDQSNKAIKPIAADDVDYANVREYRYGDQLKTVHWNLTARSATGTMFTRLYETYVNPSLCIVLDPVAPDAREGEDLMALMDGMVETAVAICQVSRLEGVDAEVRYVDKDGQPRLTRIANEADATTLVAGMLRITPQREAGPAATLADELVREAGLRSHGSGNVVLVTSRPDPDALGSMVEVASSRRNAMVFLAVPRSLVGRERQKFAAPLHQLAACGGAWWLVESNPIGTEVVGL